MRVIGASEPPASMTSARPSRIIMAASPIAWAEPAHAETVAKLGPLEPMSIATRPDAMLGSVIGTTNGDSLLGPLVMSVSVPCSNVSIPPMPVPTSTPTRSAIGAISRPAWDTASRVATTASWL